MIITHKKRNSTIELMRFVACILVISIHSHVFSDSSRILYEIIPMGIGRIAVPFFLVISGYFFFKRLSIGRGYSSYIMRFFKAWIIFSILELIIAGSYYYPQFEEPFVFWQKFVMVGLGDAYWYLWTAPISILLLVPLWKKKSVMLGLFIGFILFITSMSNDSYSSFFTGTWLQEIFKLHQLVFFWTGAGFVAIVFFLSIGAWIANNDDRVACFANKHSRILIILTVICILLLVLETVFTMTVGVNDTVNKLSLIPVVPLLFILCLRYQCSNASYDYLGSLSWYIYLIHPITVDIGRMLALTDIGRYIFAVTLSVLLSVALKKMKISL